MPRFGLDPIYTGRDDESLLDVPTTDALGATVRETFSTSPSPAFFRANAAEIAEEGTQQAQASVTRFGRLPEYNVAPDSPVLSKADADARIDAAGLTGRLQVPEDGIRSRALDLLLEYKSDEVRNQFILERYRGGVAGGAAQLTTALVTSLADPVNIASAFVPVVGEARYASLLGRAGKSMTARAGVRAGAGAVEGTVGAAIVEPLIYTSKQAIQADYDTTDSLLNIGFGAVFGGVLQPAAGGVADVLARRAGMGAWAENVRPDLTLPDSNVPADWIAGGGTRFVDGDDYVAGQWAVADAGSLRAGAEPFAAADAGQLGAAPWADSGAPVVAADGAVVAGNRRMATVLADYGAGRGAAYRAEVLAQAERYGLDSEAVSGMAAPVLVRVAGQRDAGAWGAYRTMAENTPEARAQRADQAAAAEVLPAPSRSMVEAAQVIDDRLAELERRGQEGALSETEVQGLLREDQELVGLLRDQRNAEGVIASQPGARLTPDELALLNTRRVEIRSALEGNRTARTFATALQRLHRKLERIDSDTGLANLAAQLSPLQHRTALSTGVAQVVNGDHLDVKAVGHLDGTQAGVERFLEARRVAEADLVAGRDTQLADLARIREEVARFSPEEAAQLDQDVAALEQQLREQVRAAGGDVADVDNAIAEVAELTEAADTEAKALRGVALCMLRNS